MLNLAKTLRRFAKDKTGAMTVDWVALTAAVVIIGITIVYSIFGNDEPEPQSNLRPPAQVNMLG